MSSQNLLIVDDDPLSREFLVEAVRSLGHTCQAATSGDDALRILESSAFDVVLTDLRMPGNTDGMDLIDKINQNNSDLPVILVTAHGTVEAAVQAMRVGAADFVIKPCTAETIELVLKRLEHTRRLEQQNEYFRAEYATPTTGELVAESAPMKETLESSKRLANSKGTVLITGESGTGKERVAQYIHDHSQRADGPFIRVNCAALSEQLLESELFGHERGAFTGAYKRRAGRFELADGGTLLLDEIGEISPGLQSKLLRVLEEEEFERVGSSQTLRVDVRVVATTNRDLHKEVQAGTFREDLYYRLHVLPVHLSPLRERAEDILPLAGHFAEHYGKQRGIETMRFSVDGARQLRSWSWPGNVRELENVIQRAVVLAQGDTIEARDLLFGPAGSASTANPPSANGAFGNRPAFENSNPFQTPSPDLPTSALRNCLANRTIADIEREAILGTLESTGGNKTEAARRLGVTARTISNKMKLWRQLGLVA